MTYLLQYLRWISLYLPTGGFGSGLYWIYLGCAFFLFWAEASGTPMQPYTAIRFIYHSLTFDQKWCVYCSSMRVFVWLGQLLAHYNDENTPWWWCRFLTWKRNLEVIPYRILTVCEAVLIITKLPLVTVLGGASHWWRAHLLWKSSTWSGIYNTNVWPSE